MGISFAPQTKDSKRTVIQATIRYKGKRYKFSTKESVEMRYWNEEKKRCREVREYEESLAINNRLNKFEQAVKYVLSNLNPNVSPPNFDALSQLIFQKLSGVNPNAEGFSQYVQNKTEVYRTELSPLTIKKYITLYNKLVAYENARKIHLRFEDVNIDFYRDFKQYIYTLDNKGGRYSLNYFGSFVKSIKKFMNDGILDNKHSSQGHKHPDFKTVTEDADTIYLSEEELKKIYQFEFTEEALREFYPNTEPHKLKLKIKSLDTIRKRFIIGAYTLLRVSDYKRLSEVNIEGNFIKIKPTKTFSGRKNNDIIIPIHPVVKEIIESGYDLRATVSEQKINKHIKEICKIIGFNNLIIQHKTEGGVLVAKRYEKWELVTTHTARRSGATNMILAGMVEEDVMAIGGWHSRSSFRKYLRMEAEENAKRIAQHPFFK